MTTQTRSIPGLNLDSDLAVNMDSWAMSLKANGRRPATVQSYLTSVSAFDKFLRSKGMPRKVASLRRDHVEAFQTHLLANFAPATAGIRHRSLKVFFRWLVEAGEITASPMANMSPPTQDEKVKPVYSHEQIQKLLASVKRDNTYLGKRDYAVMMLLASTGMRRSELANLLTDGVVWEQLKVRKFTGDDAPSGFIDWEQNTVELHRTKGRKTRTVHVHPNVRNSLLRYMRERQTHSKAMLPWLWLGVSGKVTHSEVGRFGTFGVAQMMKRRCQAVGLPYLPPHNWRHAWVIRSREQGVSDASLVVNAGWSEKSAASMLARYSRAEESELARAEEAERGYGGTLG